MRKTIQATGKLWLLILLIGMVMSAQVYATEGTQPETGAQGAQDNAAKSGDNSLSTLSISPGTLSPAFQYNNTNYTASVGEEVTSVEVNAKTSNENAVVESISGNADLKVGENTISIIVKAENGVVATYKIVVTRGGAAAPEEAPQGTQENGQEPEQNGEDAPQTPEANGNDASGITINGHPFNLAPVIPEDAVPQDFTKITVDCQGQQVEGLKYDKGALTLVYLTTPSTEVKNTLAVYEETSNKLYPFRKVQFGETNYLILLDPPAETGLSQEYTQATQTMEGFENVPVFVHSVGEADQKKEKDKGIADSTDFSLVYGMSSFGNIGWYQYDTVESSFQRLRFTGESEGEQGEEQEEEPSVEMKGLQNAYKDLEEQYNKKKDSSRKTTAVMIFIIAVLVVVIINLIIRNRKDEGEDLDDPDDREPKLRLRKRSQKTGDFDDDEPKSRRRNKKSGQPDEEEKKPRAKKRAQMRIDAQEDLWGEGTASAKTIGQETRPMFKHDKTHATQGGLSKGAASSSRKKLSEAMASNTQNRPSTEPIPNAQRKSSKAAAPNSQRRMPEEVLFGAQKRPQAGSVPSGQRRPSEAAVPSSQRRSSEAAVPGSQRRPSEAAAPGGQRRSQAGAVSNPQRRPSEAALSSQKGTSTGPVSNPQRRASEAAAPNPQRRASEAAAPNPQRRASEAAAPNSQRRASEAAAPNPQRRASEAAAPNSQRRPPEAVSDPQRKPSPPTTITAEPHGNPSILSEELDDEFEVIDLEDL
ncbi:MAG: hypothetical protein HFI71_12050 [Lachnospiraceae bacterium]|nr:hypothetical protein [Lachnospiraceae bacterium]